VVDLALQRDRSSRSARDDYGEQVVEVLTWLDGTFPAEHPFARTELFPGVGGNPEPWLLGSSPGSAVIAGRLGMRYCFAGFINPRGVRSALDLYRREFRPSTFVTGVSQPTTMIGLNVSCAETEEAAARRRASVELFYVHLSRGRIPPGMTAPDAAIGELGGLPEPTRYIPGEWPRQISAAPTRLREMLESMADEVGADEIVLQDLIADPTDRRDSYRLIAETFDLGPQPAEPASPRRTAASTIM
jgi:luciferase family oxidoreductase group 1